METIDLPAVTAGDIGEVTNPTPEFLGWVWECYHQSDLDSDLDMVVGTVVACGLAATVVEALQYLNDFGQQHILSPLVGVTDLHRHGRRHRRLQQLRTLTRNLLPVNEEKLLRHGQIGHQAITTNLRGASFTPEDKPEVNRASQLSLFDEEVIEIDPLPFERKVPLSPDHVREQTRQTMRQIRSCCDSLAELVHQPETQRWPQVLPRHQTRLTRLVQALESIYGSHLRQLTLEGQQLNQYPMLLTLLSWGQAALFRQRLKNDRILFKEIPVVSTRHGFSGGQVDALEVRKIGGKTPSATQRETLSKLSRQTWGSTDSLITYLRKVFNNAALQIVVIDFKFLVGDIFRSSQDTVIPDVDSLPLEKHRHQMLRYLTLIPVAYNHRRHKKDDNGGIWKTTDFSLKGEIWYFLPDQKPVIHELSLTPDEREQQFVNIVIANWRAAHRRATIRQFGNLVLGHLVNKLTGRNGNAKNGKNTDGQWPQSSLFPSTKPTLVRFIEEQDHNRHVFLDPNNVIEIVGRKKGGQPEYEFHLDAFIRAVDTGRLPAGNFYPDRNCMIYCPFPSHRDKTASFHLYVEDSPPRYHCYGCKAHGMIALDSIPPASVRVLARSWQQPSRKLLPRERTLHVPPEHVAIMECVQRLLVATICRGNNPGSRYLTHERELDLDLALEFGAGYWDDSQVITGLFETGYDLEQLFRYGFIDFSSKIKPTFSLVRILQDLGLTLEQIRRPVDRTSGSGETIWGFPYTIMGRRVTFPLTLGGLPNNFYGRATFPCHKRLTHRKLSTRYTHVPQGGFNMAALNCPPDQEVIVTEGTIDALSLTLMGFTNIAAIIGLDNFYIISEVARAGRSVAITLDDDESGRSETPKLIANLRELGLTKTIRDLTPEIRTSFPGKRGWYKDPNIWWVDFKKHLRTEGELEQWFAGSPADNAE